MRTLKFVEISVVVQCVVSFLCASVVGSVLYVSVLTSLSPVL